MLAVYDEIGVGTGFVGVTDRRIVLQDASFVGGELRAHLDPVQEGHEREHRHQQVRYSAKFSSTGEIAIHVGSQTYHATFRGTRQGDARAQHDPALHPVKQRLGTL